MVVTNEVARVVIDHHTLVMLMISQVAVVPSFRLAAEVMAVETAKFGNGGSDLR